MRGGSRFGNALHDHVDLLTRFPRMGSTIRKRSRVRKLLHSPILVDYQIREDLSGPAAANFALARVIASEYPGKPVQVAACTFALAMSARSFLKDHIAKKTKSF
jgi:hypothetical protein